LKDVIKDPKDEVWGGKSVNPLYPLQAHGALGTYMFSVNHELLEPCHFGFLEKFHHGDKVDQTLDHW
jgi:hypothetical protein